MLRKIDYRIRRVAGNLIYETNPRNKSTYSRYRDKGCQTLKGERGKQLSGRSPNKACMLHKMGGYLTRCHGNTSSPRHHGSAGVAGRLAEDRQECDTQHDNLDTTPAAYKL